ncbi:MAG: CHASE2 domain-containing protein [Verrucomicrobiota bacterium]
MLSKTRAKHLVPNAVICASTVLIVSFIVWLNPVWLIRLEHMAGDFVRDHGRKTEVRNDMVLIGIDQDSLNIIDLLDEEEILADPSLDDMSFGFPFPRRVYGNLIEKLVEAGARIVVFDILFPTRGEGDDVLKSVIEKYPDKVVVGMNIHEPEVGKSTTVPRMEVPSDSVLEWEGSGDPRVGFVNYFPDEDDKVRSAHFYHKFDPRPQSPVYHSLATAALKQLGEDSKVPFTLAPQHFRFTSMRNKVGESAYEPIPLYTIFHEGFWQNNFREGEFFADKIVYVGGTSIAYFHDVVNSPEGEILGPHLQMNVLAAALAGEFYNKWSPPEMFGLVVAFGLVAFLFAFVFSRPILGLVALFGFIFAYFFAVILPAYNSGAYLLGAIPPLASFGFSGLVCYGYRFTSEIFEKARLRRTLERQMSPKMAKHILDRPEDFYSSIPGQRVPVTILFSDIRGFTTRSENDDPIQLVSQLKEYLTAMVEIVEKHNGIVDKFIGDAVMAVWNPVESLGPERDAQNAVAAAMEMHEKLDQLNRKWLAEERDAFAIGIGLNFGEAIFGQMGSEGKQELTVIGDPVNQAARLEGLTKKFGAKTLISESVSQYTDKQFRLRSLGDIQTKGKSEAAALFSVIGKLTDTLPAEDAEFLERYEAGLAVFRAGKVDEAKDVFEKCLEDRPTDIPSKLYLDEIEIGTDGGVLVMREK